MTIDELGERINEFGHVTDIFEHAANRMFIRSIHAQLKEGGVWGWPAACETYRKVGEGFELVESR